MTSLVALGVRRYERDMRRAPCRLPSDDSPVQYPDVARDSAALARTVQLHFTSSICPLGDSDCRLVAKCTTCGTLMPTIASLSTAGCLPMRINKSNLLSAVAAIAIVLAGTCFQPASSKGSPLTRVASHS
jgi:hypothetical protein